MGAVIEKDGKRYAFSGRMDDQSVLVKNLETHETEVMQIRDVGPVGRVTVVGNEMHIEFSLFDSCNSTVQETEDRKGPQEKSLAAADSLLSLAEVDHTAVDVFAVDEEHKFRCGRPWMTVVMDAHSRMAVGVFISSDRPEATD